MGRKKEMGRGRVQSRNRERESGSAFSRAVAAVFGFLRLAEFEILFVLFFIIAFFIFKDLVSRPEYNQILVKRSGGVDLWPF